MKRRSRSSVYEVPEGHLMCRARSVESAAGGTVFEETPTTSYRLQVTSYKLESRDGLSIWVKAGLVARGRILVLRHF